MTPEAQLRINHLEIKDYIYMRLSENKYATNVTYHKIRCLNIKSGGNFQQAILEIDDSFDFSFEPSKDALIKFTEIHLNQ